MTSFEKFLLLYDICLPPMLTGVRGGHFYIVSAGISFYIRIVGFCFWLYVVFISALLLRVIFPIRAWPTVLIFPFFFFFCQHLLFCCDLLPSAVLAVLCPIKSFSVVVLSCQVSLQLNYRVRCIFMDGNFSDQQKTKH